MSASTVTNVVFVSLLIITLPLQADILLKDDFQDGDANGWQAMGKGDVKLTHYKKNISLSLTNQAAAITHFSSEGFQSLTATVSLAADSLEENEQCIAEISTNKGRSWQIINRLSTEQADAVTLYKEATTIIQNPTIDTAYLRMRVLGNQNNDTCWFDNVRVSGRRIASTDEIKNRKPFPAESLIVAKEYKTPVPTYYFEPSAKAIPPQYYFEGQLSLSSPLSAGGSKVFKNLFSTEGQGVLSAASIPLLQASFIQHGDQLIPIDRHIIDGEHSRWNYLLASGRVWSEPEESKFSRAAIPFALLEKNKNCTHNGLMTFLYNDKGLASDLALQITSETCHYYQFDMWGFVEGDYLPKTVVKDIEFIAQYEKELSSQISQKPISALSEDYPGVDYNQFASDDEIDPNDLTLFGLIKDGTHYVGGCDTRYGIHPYCDSLAVPSYSVAKSLFAGLAMMRLEALYPGVMDKEISAYVPACQTKKWRGVTFRHLLDMTSGNYDSVEYMLDEDSKQMGGFFNESHHTKNIELACSMFKHRSKPGKKWVYHTSDTYILGTAMQNFLLEASSKASNKESDIYQNLIVEPLWQALNLSPVSGDTLRSDDEYKQAFVGYGLTFYRDDIAKIAIMLQGKSEKLVSSLDQTVFKEALLIDQPKNKEKRKSLDYKNGFWSTTFRKIGDCVNPIQVPFMSGYGGITIAFLPNNIVYYYFSDNNNFIWQKAVSEAHKITPFNCK